VQGLGIRLGLWSVIEGKLHPWFWQTSYYRPWLW